MHNSNSSSQFWKQGEPCLWGAGLCFSFILVLIFTLLSIILINGLGVFWPSPVIQFTLKSNQRVTGEIIKTEKDKNQLITKYQIKTGNRDLYGLDFTWVETKNISCQNFPQDVMVLERIEYGNFIGFLTQLKFSPSLKVQNKTFIKSFQTHECPSRFHIHTFWWKIFSIY